MEAGKKSKQPYFIKPERESLIAVAALWEHWLSKDGESIKSCCLLTREANEFMRPIHHRMPVILNKEQQNYWLSHKIDNKVLNEVLVQNPSIDLIHYPVTRKMSYAGYKQREAVKSVDNS